MEQWERELEAERHKPSPAFQLATPPGVLDLGDVARFAPTTVHDIALAKKVMANEFERDTRRNRPSKRRR
jgi:hypothetical protein